MKPKSETYEMRFYPSSDGGVVWKHSISEDFKYSVKIVAACPHPEAVKAAKRLMDGDL